MTTAPQTETPRITVAQAGGRWLSRTFLPPWWLLLITGVAWIVVAIILLRFDYVSVYSISLLFGFVAIAAGILEIGAVFMAPGWWKLLNAILALVFLVAGVLAFVSPGDTFVSLAAIFSFVLIFAGAFDIITSISSRKEIEVGGCNSSAGSSSSRSASGQRVTTAVARFSWSPGWPPSRSSAA
jgi:uncharacterized membrane protein HdeD (DUF308 family)